MKYLFINVTAGYGSTGRIVADTCRDLMAQGHDCRIGFGRFDCSCPDIPSWRISSEFHNKVNGLLSRAFDNHGFGLREDTRRFLKQVEQYDPDVIWLHNIHGYYIHVGLLFEYLKTCGKKIIWTLHDCWSFTGHCVHFDYIGCEKWKTCCNHCPQLREYPASWGADGSRRNYMLKKQLFTGIPDLHLIVPSHWLEGKVKESFLKDYPVEVVYNTVDTMVFKPSPSAFRKQFGLEEKKILLGVASNWHQRKGLEDFHALAGMLDDSYRIVLVGLDEEEKAALPSRILGLPRTENLQQLAEIYSAADLYISPSVEETFGMTVLEAACCGTHPVVYAGTACEEIARKFGGTVVPRGPEFLKQAVMEFFGEEAQK